MPGSFREGMQNCVRYATHATQLPKPEECPSDSSPPDSMEQDYYYQDDPHCPCYMCANGIDAKSNYSDDEASTGVEFAVRNFWRLAKSQNDVESPMEGQCRGFHYKLLLHPRGTAGTDSESSHLSVFVEAVVQDWYPEYWVFPNVRFELTVVNFKDPKQSVTSWAHWSFSSDATSRGWQKMISHSSLTKTAGFLDDEGTVLVRGKAEPPYPLLWSKDPLYHPPMMWEYIPNRAQREVACELPGERHYMCSSGGGANKYNRKFLENFSCHSSCTLNKHSPLCKFALLPRGDPPSQTASGSITEECGSSSLQATGGAYSPNSFEKVTSYESAVSATDVKSLLKPLDALSINLQEQQNAPRSCKSNSCGNVAILKILDSIIPCIQPTLDADLVAIMTHILYHIREFRKQIFMWTPPPSTTTSTQASGNNQQQQTDDSELKQDDDSNIIVALQKTFAYMQLYPLAVAYKIYKLSGGEDSNVSKYYMYELWPKLPVTRRGYGNHHIHYKNNVNCDGEGAQLNCCVYGGGTFEWELVDVERDKTSNGIGKSAAAKLVSPPECKEATSPSTSNEDHAMDPNWTKYTMAPGTLSYSIGQRPDVFEKLLPQPPSLKSLLKAMHMTDLQVLDIHDQLVNIHSELFTMLLRDLAIAKRNLKRSRIFSGSVRPEDVPFYLRDQTELEATCKSLFSGCNESEGLFHNATVGDISSIYIRCKHSHSLQRAIKATAKNLAKYPDVLFFYLYPAKNAKRGELFDVPLRLDCTHLSDPFAKRGTNSQDSSTLNQSSSNSQEFKRSLGGSTLGADGEANTTTSGANIPPSRFTFAYSEEDDVDDDDDDDDDDDTDEGDEDTDADERKVAGAVDDDDTDEGDVSDATRTYPTSASGMKADAVPIKWYSLYALVIKEGDVRGETLSNNGNGFYWLLLRPEEDGPWFRICEGRVERLVTKMEFTEWKCHRDFFCAAAVYIAEDYIDMLQVGEVDLTGCLKTWNPDLFQETLEHLGVSAEEILNPTFLKQQFQMNRSVNNPFQKSAGTSGAAMDEPTAPVSAEDSTANEREELPEVSSDLADDLQHISIDDHQQREQTPDCCPSFSCCDEPPKTMDHFVETGDSLLDGIIYSRKIGQRHPRLYSSCEVHGYSKRLLEAIDERDFSGKMIKFASDKEVYRRIHRAEIILPFINWLFTASKENTALLNSIKVLADAKMLIKFLQQRERLFEEEFRHVICEVFFQEMGEHMATNSIYRWPNDKGCGDCNCKKCASGCPSLLLTENGRYPCEELRSLLVEPATILFRNIQILRCHLEYFCKDCRNLSFQNKTEQRRAEIAEFKATSERSALFLIECIWDACVRYTQDCRTIIYLKSTADPNTVINSVSIPLASGNPATCALEQMCQFGTQKKTSSGTPPGNGINVSTDNPKDLFVFDGSLSQNTDILDGDVADYYETKYDLSIENEHKIMNYYKHEYDIPTATEMRKYLRDRQMLVHGLVRPHELATCYLEYKYPDQDFRKELADLGIVICWNERAFAKRASLAALSHEERKLYGISSTAVDVDIINIGNALCDNYQSLISKMLLHMQDADKSMDTIYYDYVYTCSDIGKVVDAIQSECAKTLDLEIPQLDYLRNEDVEDMGEDEEPHYALENDGAVAAIDDLAANYDDDIASGSALGLKKPRKEVCSCEAMYSSSRIPTRPHIPCIPDFTITISPGGNKEADGFSSCSSSSTSATATATAAASALPPETPLPLEDDTETKPKRKAKVRKQNVEKGACIVPPLDYKLAHMVINQQMACGSFERLFPKITDLMKHSHLNSHVEHLGKLPGPGGEGERVCILGQSRTGGYDFNLAMNFAKMLKVKNAGDKSLPNPLLLMRDQDDQRAKRIKTAIEIGLITSHDLCGCEGFASEERIKPTKRLMVFTEVVWDGKVVPTRVEHLYWALRKFMHNQIPVDFDNRYMPPSKTKKPKGVAVKCVCGGSCGGDDENECRKSLKWRPVPRDAFILYALRAESNNPLRKGRRRFMFMHPESELLNYVTLSKNSEATRNPNVIILMVGAPSTLYNSPTPFPLTDDSEYPLLLFKWMCIESVDLLTIGAVVCDSKKQLQQYIFEWLLPTVRDMGYLERLGSSEKEDIDNYQVLEECSVRTVQNVRRWSCAIRKINKRTGDIIITQLKRTVDSPPSLRFKEAVAFMHTVRDLAELEALELLPPSAASLSGENFNASSSQPLTSLLSIQETEQDTEGNEKPAEDSQKLKKKKKKAPKTAIPANKRSNFSRSLHDNDESRIDDEEYDDLGSYEQATPEQQSTPQPEPQQQLKSVDLYNMLEEALEALMVYDATIAISKLAAGVAKAPNSGLIAPLTKGHVQEEFVQDAIAYICDVLIDDLDAFDQLVPVDTSVCKHPSIRTTATPRSRAAVDLLVSFAKFEDFQTVVERIIEKDTFKAAALGFYLLCAIGTLGIEKWRSQHQSSLVATVESIAKACIEHASWFFIDRESRLYNDVLQSILFGLEALEPIELALANNPNLLYLLGICRDRTQRSLDGSGTSAQEEEEEEAYIPSYSRHGFRRVALEAFTGGKPQVVDTDKRIGHAFASLDSPFMHNEHLEELDKVTLQALCIWWRRRELALANLRSSIIAAGGIDLDVSTLGLNYHAYCRLLEECCHRFGDEIFLANGNGHDPLVINGNNQKCNAELSVALVANQEHSTYFNGNEQTNGFKRQKVDYNSLDAMLAPLTSLDTKSSRRGIPNVPLYQHHETTIAASVYEMRLQSQTVALVVMSLAKDGKVTRTKSIQEIIQRYYSLAGHHLPAAPSFAPPNTVATT